MSTCPRCGAPIRYARLDDASHRTPIELADDGDILVTGPDGDITGTQLWPLELAARAGDAPPLYRVHTCEATA